MPWLAGRRLVGLRLREAERPEAERPSLLAAFDVRKRELRQRAEVVVIKKHVAPFGAGGRTWFSSSICSCLVVEVACQRSELPRPCRLLLLSLALRFLTQRNRWAKRLRLPLAW